LIAVSMEIPGKDDQESVCHSVPLFDGKCELTLLLSMEWTPNLRQPVKP
jgi:hypothetical protein